jgi:hypothetical protein
MYLKYSPPKNLVVKECSAKHSTAFSKHCVERDLKALRSVDLRCRVQMNAFPSWFEHQPPGQEGQGRHA